MSPKKRTSNPQATTAVAARVARFDERLQSAGGLLIRCTLRLREDELVAHYRALLARTPAHTDVIRGLLERDIARVSNGGND